MNMADLLIGHLRVLDECGGAHQYEVDVVLEDGEVIKNVIKAEIVETFIEVETSIELFVLYADDIKRFSHISKES